MKFTRHIYKLRQPIFQFSSRANFAAVTGRGDKNRGRLCVHISHFGLNLDKTKMYVNESCNLDGDGLHESHVISSGPPGLIIRWKMVGYKI